MIRNILHELILQTNVTWVLLLLPRVCETCTRGKVIGLSVRCLFVCLLVCGQKNEHFERNRAVYELYLLRTSQKSKNISLYVTHERERTSGSQEKQTFQRFGFGKSSF